MLHARTHATGELSDAGLLRQPGTRRGAKISFLRCEIALVAIR